MACKSRLTLHWVYDRAGYYKRPMLWVYTAIWNHDRQFMTGSSWQAVHDRQFMTGSSWQAVHDRQFITATLGMYITTDTTLSLWQGRLWQATHALSLYYNIKPKNFLFISHELKLNRTRLNLCIIGRNSDCSCELCNSPGVQYLAYFATAESEGRRLVVLVKRDEWFI